MPNCQYVACKFGPEDKRTYTYHWDGEPLQPGDEVRVEDRSGDGTKRVHVAMIGDAAPHFPTKPIVEKAEPEPKAQPDLLALGDDADLAAHLGDRA